MASRLLRALRARTASVTQRALSSGKLDSSQPTSTLMHAYEGLVGGCSVLGGLTGTYEGVRLVCDMPPWEAEYSWVSRMLLEGAVCVLAVGSHAGMGCIAGCVIGVAAPAVVPLGCLRMAFRKPKQPQSRVLPKRERPTITCASEARAVSEARADL